MKINFLSKIRNYFTKSSRIYNPNSGLSYFEWKRNTFGKDLVDRLDKKNAKEGQLWFDRNRETERFYEKYYQNKWSYAA